MIENARDLDGKTPIDLKKPSNLITEIEYDYKTNRYIFHTMLGKTKIGIPYSMSAKEYMEYVARGQQYRFYRTKNNPNKTDMNETDKNPFSLTNMKWDLDIGERIFGPGGIQIKTQGSVEVLAGMKRNTVNNPTLPERGRVRNVFDFDQKVQLNVNAKVGNKINFGMNYNTDATFDFDSKRIKLAYDGEEDQILKHIEAGNVSMTTTNSLINGGAALFGIKTDLQFGKLRVNTILSQQDSESKTINSRGGVQTTPFEFGADQYDENRHFFLSFYFRDNYDQALSKLPYIQSGVSITRVEVWITNKRGNYDQARNILAFADLAEYNHIHNPLWSREGGLEIPFNEANTLYSQITNTYSGARDISQVGNILPVSIKIGQDYEKIESARLLNPSEYTVQAQLGYISLRTPLQANEVLAVAYEYTYNGKAYQVGEFSNNIGRESTDATANQNGALFLKLLKPTSLSPKAYVWDLMMKNIYSIGMGAYNIQQDRFRLNIMYQSDTTGVYLNYIPDGKINNQLLLRVMNLDRLNSKKDAYPDGVFDFIEGYTVTPQSGRIIFPVVEPFGKHLRKMIGDDAIADKYVFQELYDSTLTIARQIAEKNKFKMKGEYRGTSGSEISLNATNVTRGSVRVTAAGVTLTEGTDYTVDYMLGTVNIVNQAILDAGTPVSVSLENQSFQSLMQRKTMLGLNLAYDFSKNFTVGGTIMHLYEKPLTMKTSFGTESVQNTLWGINTSYRTQSQWLTNLVDKLPFVNATAPSQFSIDAEFAQMLPGHYKNKYTGAYSYLDDFESSTSGIDLRSPYAWNLAATPFNNTEKGLFPEAALTNNIDYGKNRAQMAWFYIDGIFTRRNSSLTPEHIKNDKNQLSNHFVREVYEREIFPNKQAVYGESATIPVFNLSYYPNERGPYNLDTDVNSDGNLLHPRRRWGGITRKMDSPDFETSNIEYIEFWLMDPFVNDTLHTFRGGDLYFNLGEISEDILKDGKKFFENGLPIDGDESAIEYTVWGKVPKRQSTVYAFDNSRGMESRRIQDVGLNGLSVAEEKEYPAYKNYIEKIAEKISSTALSRMQADEFSPLNDPGGDKFRHYRGGAQDEAELSILDRYKYYNGTEGNSLSSEGSDARFSTASRTTPDVEDIDQDNTLNENESYYQYCVQLRPDKMNIGMNYIVDKRQVNVRLRNGQDGKVNWYQFKIPLRDYDSRVGNIQNFKSIRFMRMFLTDFEQPVFLRFATLELVRSEWRTYSRSLVSNGAVSSSGTLDVSAVNIEENGDRSPVNYVLPPGVTRILDPSQPQLRQENEQAVSLKVKSLEPGDARAIYKNTAYDLRRYKRMEMFVHAERLADDPGALQTGELTVFLRLGSDYKNNYYEYEIPLRLTPPGRYSSNNASDQEAVWSPDNKFDFPLALLTELKLKRNQEKRHGTGVTYITPYSEYDSQKPNNKITIVGNPSLAEVKVMMIGIRNNSRTNKSGEVWVNELRLSDFDEKGGWAGQGSASLALSDLGTINVSGRRETVGFGSLDQSLLERRNDDFTSYNIALNMELGRFLPKEAKISAPFYYAYSHQSTAPQYDPLDKDVLLSESLKRTNNQEEKDSINNLAINKTTNTSISLNNVKVNIKSKNPMPYDPANFSFGYSYSENRHQEPEIEYATTKDYRLQVNYNYTPYAKPFEPFKHIKSKSGWMKLIKSLNISYLPNNIQVSSNIARNYRETQLRDLNAYLSGITKSSPFYLTFSQNFVWNRDFSLIWDLTRNLKTSFRSGTVAEIEEPYLQVNKKLNRDDYEIWKDSVVQSIRNLGRPLNYEQNTDVTYTLPLKEIPLLDWMTTSATYNARYRWQRGAKIEGEEVGNSIMNDVSLSGIGRLNLVSMYNKIPFLKKTNDKFNVSSRNNRNNNRSIKKVKKRFKKDDFQLLPDTSIEISHNLKTKRFRILAKDEKGKSVKIRYKTLDKNKILIKSNDSLKINLQVIPKPPLEKNTWYRIAQYVARGVMSLRSVDINYNYKTRTDLPGFRPMIGDVFGQRTGENGLVPGLGFAFGWEGGEKYIEKAKQNDWLVSNSNNITPALYNCTQNLRINATLEPIKGLKIDLNAFHEKNDRTEVRYMFDGMPKIFGGTFAMTTISIGSAFENSTAKNSYQSAAFDAFLKNRQTIAARLRNQYKGTTYPSQGFISETSLGGQPFNASVNDINLNSADVLVPAFLSAYTGKNASKIELTAFPSIWSMLPNWDISYNAINTLPWLKENFKSFTLSHKYTSQYRVGNYSSFLNWLPTGEKGDLGYIRNVLNGMPIPSSPFEISAVSLMEAFSPLFEARGVLNNNMSLSLRMNRNRSLNLNIASYQIVEMTDNDFVLGLGYRMPDFNRIVGFGSNTTREKTAKRKSRRNRNDNQQTENQSRQPVNTTSGFNNDLNVRLDISYKTTQALIRKIEDQFTQATSGLRTLSIKFSADYAMSRSLTLRAYFDRMVNTPLVSSSSYPTATTSAGLSLRFNLTQ